MTRRRLAQYLSGFLGLFGVLCAGSAFAERAPSAPLAIDADASVRARWPDLVDRLREAFDGRDDIDRRAHVELSSLGGAVTIDVALPDGRSTARSVSRREDIVPTLEALLLLPEREVEQSPVSPAAPVPIPAPASAAAPKSGPPPLGMDPASNRGLIVEDREGTGRSRAEPSAHLRIELSLLAGARVGDGYAGGGLGARSLVDAGGWLFGIQGRVDRYAKDAENDGSGAVEAAALAGRRFRFDGIALDVVGGPAAAFQGTTTRETRSSVTRTSVIESSSSTVPRVLVESRLTFGAESTWRTFVAIDGNVGPRRMGSSNLPGAPELPLWTVGLAVGATVGTL